LASEVGVVGAGQSAVTPSEKRAYLSFDLNAVGAGRQIKAAVLSFGGLSYGNSSGIGDPFSFGPLWAESLDYGPTLDPAKSEFDLAASWFKQVATAQAPSFAMNVLDPVAVAYSLSPRVQFRLKFLNIMGSDGIGMAIPTSQIKLTIKSRLP